VNIKQTEMRPFDILLVEDSPSDVRLMQESLKECKILHNLSIVEDGQDAMDFLQKTGKFTKAPSPDLILLDLNLPKKNGREVLEEIKNDPGLRQIPVVVLTSSKAEEDIVKSYKLHCNAYITKPFDIKGLIEVTNSIKHFWLAIVKLPPKK